MEREKTVCEELLQELFGYIDDELPEDACAVLQQHLAGCGPCEDFVQTMRRSVEVVKGYQVDTKPGPLPESAKAELRRLYQQALKEADAEGS
jgi:anti-sigma factor RsiW